MRTPHRQPFPIGLLLVALAIATSGGVWVACFRDREAGRSPAGVASRETLPTLELPAVNPPRAPANATDTANVAAPVLSPAEKPTSAAVDSSAPPSGGAPRPEDRARHLDEGESDERTEAVALEPPRAPAQPKLAPPTTRFPEIARLIPLPAKHREGTVARVVDGDTIELEGGVKLRFVGINTPERMQPLYEEAREFTASLIAERRILYTQDREPRDSYGRDLAYVFTEDGRFLNGELVRRGLAYIYTWEPNTRYAKELLELQRAARADGLGLWSLPPPSPCAAGYVSEPRSHVFHRPECRSACKIPEERRVTWTSRIEALDTGRNPCRMCKP